MGEHWHTGFAFWIEQVSKSPQDMTAQGSTQYFLPLMLMLQRAVGGQSACVRQATSRLQPWRGLSGLPAYPSKQMQVAWWLSVTQRELGPHSMLLQASMHLEKRKCK